MTNHYCRADAPLPSPPSFKMQTSCFTHPCPKRTYVGTGRRYFQTKFPICAKQDSYIQWWWPRFLTAGSIKLIIYDNPFGKEKYSNPSLTGINYGVTLIDFLPRFCLTRTGSLSEDTLPWWNLSRLRRTSSACWPSENLELSAFLVRVWRPGPKPWRARPDEGLLPHPVHGVACFGGPGPGYALFPFNNIHVFVKRFGWPHWHFSNFQNWYH